MATDFNTLEQKAVEVRDEVGIRKNTAWRVGSLFLELANKIKEAFASITAEETARAGADTALQQSIAAASFHPLLTASGMADLYEKLDDTSWWGAGFSQTDGKPWIRKIKVYNWTFTLIAVKSDVITQYLIGPAILLEDGTFNTDEAYYESYILKRTHTGASNPGRWHYIDRPGFVNVDLYKPLAEGYYTLATAREALPGSMRKSGTIITWKSSAETWQLKQFTGTVNLSTGTWSDNSQWKDIALTEAWLSGNVKSVSGGSISYLGKNNEAVLTDNGATVSLTGNRKFLIPTTPLSGSASRYYARDSGGYMAAMTGAQMKGSLSIMDDAPDDGKLYLRQHGVWVEVTEETIKRRVKIVIQAPYGTTAGGGGMYIAGTQATVTAAVESGYRWIGWQEDGLTVSSGRTYTFTAMADRTLYASAVEEPTPTPTPAPTGGPTPTPG